MYRHTDETHKKVSEFLTPNKNRQRARGREANSFADKQKKETEADTDKTDIQTNRKRLTPVVNCLHPNHNK